MAEAMLLEAARLDGWQYKFTLLYLVVQLAVIAALPVRVRHPRRSTRPASDATWFLPVSVWGLESIRNGYWWIFEAPFIGIAKTVHAFLPRIELAAAALMVTTAVCLSSEHLARRRRLPCRAAAGSVPASVVAAIIAVQSIGGLWLLVFVPITRA